MRHIRIAVLCTAVVVILSGLQAYAQPSPAPSPAAAPLPVLGPATFQGETPCGDCPGVDTTVTLKSDGTYTLKRVYLERKSTFQESGTWSYDQKRARLTLFPTGKGNTEEFSITFSAQLHMLDADGNPLPSRMNSTLVEVESTTSTLAATGWTLVELGGKPIASAEPHPVTMQFDPLGERVSGSGGCNQYNGSYKQEGNKLGFGVLASTKMMCATMTVEDAYFAMLAKVATFLRNDQTLTLYDKGGAALARFGIQK